MGKQYSNRINYHLQKTIQTHNAVSLGAGVSSNSSFFDTDGFDAIALTVLNDASSSLTGQLIWSHDGVNQHGVETPFNANSYQWLITDLKTKAKYVRVWIMNNDTIAHTVSSWIYFKA